MKNTRSTVLGAIVGVVVAFVLTAYVSFAQISVEPQEPAMNPFATSSLPSMMQDELWFHEKQNRLETERLDIIIRLLTEISQKL